MNSRRLLFQRICLAVESISSSSELLIAYRRAE